MNKKILDKIIKTEYKSRLQDWQAYAKPNDLLGLQCIQQIYNTKGKKKLHVSLPVEKQMYETHQSLMSRKGFFSLQQAQQNFRRKQLTTSYQFYHGGLSAPKERTHNIFVYKTLAKLQLARPLTDLAINFIDNWLSIRDNKKYEELVLSCLRSLNSKIFLTDPNSTQMKTKYNWKQDWNLSKPVRMDKAGQYLFAFKPNYSAIKKQQQKQLKFKQKLKQLQQTDFAKQLSIFKQFKIN